MATEDNVSPWYFTYKDKMRIDLAPLTAREREFMETLVAAAFVSENRLRDMTAFDTVRRLMHIERREFNELRNRMLRKHRIKTEHGCIVPVVDWAVNPSLDDLLERDGEDALARWVDK